MFSLLGGEMEARQVHMEKNCLAVGRIRTYAPRGNLISSQTP